MSAALDGIEVTNAHPTRQAPTEALTALVARVIKGEKRRVEAVGLILTDDATIHQLNRDFLGHDYVTDVISFRLNDPAKRAVEGEVYVSLDQAERQAPDFGATYPEEALRLAIHGLLHLCGWDDATDAQRQAMHERESHHLADTAAARVGW